MSDDDPFDMSGVRLSREDTKRYREDCENPGPLPESAIVAMRQSMQRVEEWRKSRDARIQAFVDAMSTPDYLIPEDLR